VQVVLQALLIAAALGASLACSPVGEPSERAHAEAKAELAPSNTPPADAERSATGLISKMLAPGHGEQRPAPYDKVRVHFTAWNTKGEVTDGTALRGGPATFEVTGVIAGWSEALQQMRVGERRRLWIPDHLAYPGRPGFPRPLALFELELLEIIPGKAPPPAPSDVGAVPEDAVKTRSGLAYKLLAQVGGLDKPRAWDRVTLHYAGWTRAGVLIESSRKEGAIFDVASVMPGWREALQLLSVGDRARVWIPEALAYPGQGGVPQGDVVFELELVAVERRPEPPRPPRALSKAPGDARKTKTGLAYRMLKQGDGKTRPKPGDRVQVHYSAWTSDGALLDSSVVRGKPATVPLDRIIPGWAEGLQLMHEGGKALLWIPESLAYAGQEGSPKGPLVYEVELLKIAR
jgi:peptidylprolyl isomerase